MYIFVLFLVWRAVTITFFFLHEYLHFSLLTIPNFNFILTCLYL